MAITAAAACQNHPQREALGVCVHCRRRVCSECTTKVDGINHCVGCLSELANAERARPGQEAPARRFGGVWAALHVAVLCVLAWSLLEAALPGLGGG